MTNPVERLFAFIDAPQERPWVAMGALVVFFLLGAGWVNQAQVLPGVSASETGLTGPVDDVVWGPTGAQAVALVEGEVMHRDVTGAWTAVDLGFEALSLGGAGHEVLVGGVAGAMAVVDVQTGTPTIRSLSWSDGLRPDVLAIDGTMTGGWLLVDDDGTRSVHTWAGLQVGSGSPAPGETIVMTDLQIVADRALLIGYDTSAGNPMAEPRAEVLVEAVAGDAPSLTLIHRGSGAPFHTLVATPTGAWSEAFIALVAGPDGLYGVQRDSAVIRLPAVTGCEGISMDTDGTLWMIVDGELVTFGQGDVAPEVILLPDGMGVDLERIDRAGTHMVMFETDGAQRTTIDPDARHSLLRSLSLLGDLVLVMTLLGFVGFGGHALLRKHDVL